MTNNIREERVTVRLSEDELQRVKTNAESIGLSTATYMRSASLRIVLKPRLTEEDRNILRTFTGAANNLNQLAKNSHNQNMFSMSVEIANTLETINNIIHKFK